MKPDFQRRVQRYGWTKAAGYYEPHWQRQLWPAQERLLHRAQLQPGERVLDVACGTGLVTFPAAEAVTPSGTVLGVDLSEGMLEAAREAAKARGFEHVSFARMDAEALDVLEASFDVALCALGLMYVPEPAQALGEMYRALRPGGRVVVAVWGARKNCGWAEVFPIVDRRVTSDVCPLFFQLGTGEVLQGVFEEVGFTDVAADRFSSILHYETGEEACTGIFLGGPVALAYNRFDAATQQAVDAEYLASIASYRNGAGYDIPGEFVVASGRKPG